MEGNLNSKGLISKIDRGNKTIIASMMIFWTGCSFLSLDDRFEPESGIRSTRLQNLRYYKSDERALATRTISLSGVGVIGGPIIPF